MSKLDEFMLLSRLQMQQMQDQIDAQQLVIAWMLNRLDRAEAGPSASLNFLLHQSLECSDGAKDGEFLAVFDDLAEDCARFASLERKPR